MEREIRVAVVEDQAEVRSGLAALVDRGEGMACSAAFEAAEGLLEALTGDPPLAVDVVLMDIDLPGISGIEATRRLRQASRDAGGEGPAVVMLTVYGDDEPLFESLRAGACGYLLKTTPRPRLVEAVKSVVRGGSPMSESVARRVVATFQQPSPQETVAVQLTPREREVLDLLSRGYRYREIADRLIISLDTVRTHIRHIYDKLEVRSRTEATARYLGGGSG